LLLRTLGYLTLYAGGVSVLVLFNLEVLDLGEVDLFPHSGYILLWFEFYLPLALLGAIVGGWRPSRIGPNLHVLLLLIYAAVIFVFLEFSFLLDLAWQWVLVQYLIGVVCFIGIRLIANAWVGRGGSANGNVSARTLTTGCS